MEDVDKLRSYLRRAVGDARSNCASAYASWRNRRANPSRSWAWGAASWRSDLPEGTVGRRVRRGRRDERLPRRPRLGPGGTARPRPEAPGTTHHVAHGRVPLPELARFDAPFFGHQRRARRWRWTRSSASSWRRRGGAGTGGHRPGRDCGGTATGVFHRPLRHRLRPADGRRAAGDVAASRSPARTTAWPRAASRTTGSRRPGDLHRHGVLVVPGRDPPGRTVPAVRADDAWRWPERDGRCPPPALHGRTRPPAGSVGGRPLQGVRGRRRTAPGLSEGVGVMRPGAAVGRAAQRPPDLGRCIRGSAQSTRTAPPTA